MLCGGCPMPMASPPKDVPPVVPNSLDLVAGEFESKMGPTTWVPDGWRCALSSRFPSESETWLGSSRWVHWTLIKVFSPGILLGLPFATSPRSGHLKGVTSFVGHRHLRFLLLAFVKAFHDRRAPWYQRGLIRKPLRKIGVILLHDVEQRFRGELAMVLGK